MSDRPQHRGRPLLPLIPAVMETVYVMPEQEERVFVNVVHACPNACYFCVDFKGDVFFGHDLKTGRAPTAQEMVDAVLSASTSSLKEVFFCGIGEPLLRRDAVTAAAEQLRLRLPAHVQLALNTSGTHFAFNRDLTFVRSFDLIQVSLNAESAEKYERICRPKIPDAYRVVREFLEQMRAFLQAERLPLRVELTVVDPDTSTIASLPQAEQSSWTAELRPDLTACKQIAESLGWPLKVKRLIEDHDGIQWTPVAEQHRARWRST